MQKSILYERSVTLPDTRGRFVRPRINKLLEGLLDRHLIVITSGAGWGKTHAVSMFLANTASRVIWLQLSSLDNHYIRFWEEFVYIIASQNKETAAQLEQLGFPETLVKFNQFLHILAKDIYAREQVVLVLDDFHLIHDHLIIRFVENLILAKLENFCIFITSRTKLNFNLTSMFVNNLAGHVTAEDLHFTLEETGEYLKQRDIFLSARELQMVQDFTEGWPLALYLVGLSIKKGGMVSKDPIAGAIPMIFEMIERELFSEYPLQAQTFMIEASLLNSFPKGLVKVLANEHMDIVSEFLNSNMFAYYNPYTGHYHLHHIFLEFLKGKQERLSKQEITGVYLKAAEWCARNDLKIEALEYYDRCGHHDDVLDLMLNYGIATFPKTTAEFFIELIDRFPEDLVKKSPITHVLRAGLLLNNAEIQLAVKELLETQQELEALPLDEENRFVLGNVYCMLGLLSLGGGTYDFRELFPKASQFLTNGGMIDSRGKAINTKYAIILPSPEPGALDKMEEALFYAMPYASKAMHGYGQGLEYLASAEAAYFTGDMKKAAKNAYEAVYRARQRHVSDIASSGYFLLMRIDAANGNYKGVIAHMEQLRGYASSLEDKLNFSGMLDIAEGWLQIVLGKAEKPASWIMDDTAGVLAPYSKGMERMVKARSLLKAGKYYELLAWLGQSEEYSRPNNQWLVLLDNLIYKAAASHHIRDEAQTVCALEKAYGIANGNNLTMQFIELGNDMRSVIYTVKRNPKTAIPSAWLDEISTKAATYEKHLNSIKSQDQQALGSAPTPPVKFTKSERDMLRYLCQGLTNTEIASTRYISVSAVKKSLNNIYIKLGATNRADAVRIAIQMELHI